VLQAEEAYGLDLKGNQLVSLSACETNVGELSAGDELVGLTRAFFFAGTPTILSSLWSVDDAATAALMTAFYKHWQAGAGKAQALQAAQAEVRANPQWVSPFYWAGFVLNGDPGPSEPGRSSEPPVAPAVQAAEGPKAPAGASGPEAPSMTTLPWAMILLAGAVVAAAIAVVVRRRRKRPPAASAPG
jgi:hypothetical protein